MLYVHVHALIGALASMWPGRMMVCGPCGCQKGTEILRVLSEELYVDCGLPEEADLFGGYT